MAKFASSEAGKKGGQARAKKLSKSQRSVAARRAALARWSKEGKELPQATHEGVLHIGDAEISCYVLANGERVMSTRGIMKGLGRVWRGRKYPGTQLPVFLEAKNLKPFISEDLIAGPNMVKFLTPGKDPFVAEGYHAELMPAICDTYLKAREAGVLTPSQVKVAAQAEILMRGFAHVGIIALVDEATGYQRDRSRDELAKILEAFVAKEIQKWLKTFDLEFYELICEIRDEPISRAKKRPQYFGKLTNNLIYQRLAPGVLDELERLNPTNAKGQRKRKHFQHLTPDMGHPKLKEHLAGVTTAMKMAKLQGLKWSEFLKLLDKTHPKWQSMPLFDNLESK